MHIFISILLQIIWDSLFAFFCVSDHPSVLLSGVLLLPKNVSYTDAHPTRYALQRQNAENLKQIFPEKEYRGLSPNFHIHVSVGELYISTMGLPYLPEEICGPILEIYKWLTDT
jgi:hypothetical protein